MNMNVRVHGLPEDVDLAINALRDAYPESRISCSTPYPHSHDNEECNDICVFVNISGGDK